MKFFSMFTGIGGFEYGIKKAKGNKWKCIGYSEIDKYAIQVFNKHFPGIKNYGDATKIDPMGLPDFDLLCGGFPCQSFSVAGRRMGFEDTRGTLFFDIARIVKVKRPRYLFLENVKGLLNHDNGRTMLTILATLDELGYDVEWEVLNSRYFGVPQNRERVFIIGHLRGTSGQKIFPIGSGSRETKGMEREDIAYCIDSNYHKGNNSVDKCRRTVVTAAITTENAHMFGKNVTRKQVTDIENLTGMIRRLTPVECERLQAYPDRWTEYGVDKKGNKIKMSDTQRYKMLGNSVTTNVIEEIAKRIKE